jgi:hypothetical protein
MGIRNRLKRGIKSIVGLGGGQLGRGQPPHPPSSRMVPSPPPIEPPTKKEQSDSNTIKDPVVKGLPSSAPASEMSPEPIDQEKIARHKLRTRLGLLNKIQENGGTIGLAELHDHSERRYFVGHKKFSDLMEDLVREEMLVFDWESQEATITDQGIERIQ